MAFNTNDLQLPASIGQGLTKFLNQQIRSPTNFGPTDRAFGSMEANPSIGLGPNGQFMDPNQQQGQLQTNFLGQRDDVASQNLQNQQQDASLLLSAGGTTATLENEIPFLNSQVANSSSSSPFGGFMGGL